MSKTCCVAYFKNFLRMPANAILRDRGQGNAAEMQQQCQLWTHALAPTRQRNDKYSFFVPTILTIDGKFGYTFSLTICMIAFIVPIKKLFPIPHSAYIKMWKEYARLTVTTYDTRSWKKEVFPRLFVREKP